MRGSINCACEKKCAGRPSKTGRAWKTIHMVGTSGWDFDNLLLRVRAIAFPKVRELLKTVQLYPERAKDDTLLFESCPIIET